MLSRAPNILQSFKKLSKSMTSSAHAGQNGNSANVCGVKIFVIRPNSDAAMH